MNPEDLLLLKKKITGLGQTPGVKIKNCSVTSPAGLTTSFYETGSGPSLILLHGAFSNGLCWLPVVTMLAGKFRVVVPDLPGHGNSSRTSIFYGRKTYRKWLKDFVEALNLEDVLLCGNSLGGAIAIDYSLNFPCQVSKLILVNSVSLLKQVSFFKNRRYSLQILRLAMFPKKANADSAYRLWSGLLEYYDHFKKLPYSDLLVDYTLRAIKMRSGTRPFWWGQADAMRPYSRQQLALLRIETLMIWGLKDRIAPVINALQAIDIIPGSSLYPLQDAGHVPFIDEPHDFCNLLLENFSKGSPKGSYTKII